MAKFIECRDLKENPFDLIGNDWALLGAGEPGNFNMMTVSWGQMGVLWNKNVATAYVRPQRHTKKFMDENEIFTLSFFSEEQRDLLKLCGSKSGRDMDKMHLNGLTPRFYDGALCFDQARLTLVCKKLYVGRLAEENFLDPEIAQRNYPGKDYHTVYIGEILRAVK